MVQPLYKQKKWIIKDIEDAEKWEELNDKLKYWVKQTRRKK